MFQKPTPFASTVVSFLLFFFGGGGGGGGAQCFITHHFPRKTRKQCNRKTVQPFPLSQRDRACVMVKAALLFEPHFSSIGPSINQYNQNNYDCKILHLRLMMYQV